MNFKLKTASVLLLLTAISFLNAAEKNLLANGDFKSIGKNKMPNSWRGDGTSFICNAVNGVNELQIKPVFRYKKHFVGLRQTLALPAGKYQLRGNIKGKVESIYLVVNRPQGGVKPPNAFISTKFAGSAQNWSDFVLTFDVPVAQDRAGMTLQANVPGANDPVTFRKLQVIRIGDASVNPVVSAAPKAKAPAAAKAKTAVRNAVAPKVEISGKLVARPAAASNVSWPVHTYCGRDYWYMLVPEWQKMKGLSHEKFIQEAGIRGISTPWKSVKPYRRTGIREVEIWQGGKNVASQAKIELIADERGTAFYYQKHINDNDLNTITWICGPTTDFRFTNKAVPFKMNVQLPSDKALEKIVFRTSSNSLPVWDGTLYVAANGREVSGSIFRGDNSLTLQFAKAPRGKDFYLLGMTKATVYEVADDLPPAARKMVKNKPFTSLLFHGVLKFKPIGEFNFENVDRESIKRFRKKYPNFIPEQLGEFGANFFQKRYHKSKAGLESDSTKVAPIDKNRYEAADTLRKLWTVYYDMFGGVNMLEGGLWTMPYFYEWGAGLTIPEAFNEAARYSSNRHLLTFARGGSRQYNKPFGFYQTVFGSATYANSIYSEEEAHRLAKAKKMQYHPGEDFGVSASYHLRLLMLAYYAGSTVQQFEGEPGGYAKRHKDNSWTLTNNGKSLKKVYDWVSSPKGKRGTFYSPILLLNDYHSGNWDWRQNKNGPWNVWYMYPYEDGDYMLRHLLNQLDPPIGDFAKMQEFSNGMRNSDLGDIYDVFFANAPSGAVTTEELGKYPVVLLLGDIRPVPGLTENLQQYVRDGGTVVLNSAQLKVLPAKFAGIRTNNKYVLSNNMKILEVFPDGAEILAKDTCGLPLVTRYRNGKGSVVLATPYHLLNVNNKKECLPILPALLKKLQSEVLPVSLKGDILFCFNKMSGNDWKLILINNKGTFKEPMRSKEKFFPEYAKKVTFSLPAGASAKELRLNLPVKVQNGQAEIVVPPGDVAVVELKNIPFSDSPINSKTITRKPSDPLKPAMNLNPKILIDSPKADGGYQINTQRRGDALYLPGKDSGVIYTTPKMKQMPMQEGGYSCFAKPDPLTTNKKQIVISNEYTRIDIVDGHWQLFFYDLKQLQHLRGPKVDTSKWTHVAMTWKHGQAHFYVDGKEVISEKGPLLYGGRCDGNGNPWNPIIHIYIGTFHLWRSELYKGLIKKVKCFGVAPDEEEIRKYASEK